MKESYAGKIRATLTECKKTSVPEFPRSFLGNKALLTREIYIPRLVTMLGKRGGRTIPFGTSRYVVEQTFPSYRK